jgi:hypothetical protein
MDGLFTKGPTMKRSRRLILAALAAVIVFAGLVPAAEAQGPFPVVPGGLLPGIGGGGGSGYPGLGGDTSTNATGPCGSGGGNDGQGRTGGVTNIVCQGPGLTFVGPSTGQIATVIGPTIIGTVVGTVQVSSGNSSVGGV